MQELILYVVLALIVGAMLFSVLGKNLGQGSDELAEANVDGDKFKGVQPTLLPQTQTFEGPAAKGLQAIFDADPNFNVAQFMDGAKTAYGMILEAFADGDKDTLEGLLNKDVRGTYFAAIDDRVKKELSQTTDLARLISADIISASLRGKTGKIGVAYHAELATALLDGHGEIISGDLDVLSRVKEVWRYERKLGAKNPNWVLCSVEPHDTIEGGEDGPDHSPDTV